MKDLNQLLARRMADVLARRFSLELPPKEQLSVLYLEKTRDAQFGDLACSAPLRLAKRVRQSPMKIAGALAEDLAKSDLGASTFAKIEVASPGFVNFTYTDDYVLSTAARCYADARLGVAPADPSITAVLDYSCPNVAKPMHVGHIRSTILGDALVRIFRFLGHTAIGDNHLGDWGTQFGMIILGLKRVGRDRGLEGVTVPEIAEIYRSINALSERDEATAEAARQEVVKLHSGDPENRRIWERVMAISLDALDRVYERLGVRFDHTLGESFYEAMLPGVVEDLREKGLARESEDAIAVFFENDKYPPFLVQKRDGAFLYATTDLATIRYRLEQWAPALIVYVTDARQQLHFKQLFETARMMGYVDVQLEHVWFGSILGPDGKPYKTRSGEVVRLEDLLDEAQERARAVVDEKSPHLPEEDRRRIARVVGIGALKYADLSQNRTSDYIFSWEKFLALSGNTAPYMQYAYARVQSIFRRGEVEVGELRTDRTTYVAEHPAELNLVRTLIEFEQVLQTVAREYRPNFLTAYLYELSGKFTGFYDNCPVLKAPTDTLRRSRLALCDHVGRVIKQGLNLLGIETIEQM